MKTINNIILSSVMPNLKIILVSMTLLSILISCSDGKQSNGKSSQNQEKIYAQFDADNNLIRPKDFRSWVFAGTASTPLSNDPKTLFPDFQNIYIDPVSFEYWKKHGKWREGTVLVKELLRKGDTVSPVGRGFFQGPHFDISASVKDSKRFPDMKDGWNYFGFGDFEKFKINETAAPLGNQCALCHIEKAIDGDVFYQYYPVILAAKGYGEGNPENENTREGLVQNFIYKSAVSKSKGHQKSSK